MRKSKLLLTLALAACASPAVEHPDSVPAPQSAAADRVIGTVRVVGSTPMTRVVVQPDSGNAVQVAGPLREELRNLSGARVAVSGPVRAAADPVLNRQVEAQGYQILSVDGSPVLSGTVEGRSGNWVLLRTESGELVYLGGAADQLQPGQKVWVQGPRSVVVQSYGVVRP